jgi:hypothetical protein
MVPINPKHVYMIPLNHEIVVHIAEDKKTAFLRGRRLTKVNQIEIIVS